MAYGWLSVASILKNSDLGNSTSWHEKTTCKHIDVTLHDQAFEFRERHCSHCKNGIITEKEFDNDKALNYLESIGKKDAPCGVSQAAHAQSAIFEAFKRKDEIDFYKEKSYPCVHYYCYAYKKKDSIDEI